MLSFAFLTFLAGVAVGAFEVFPYAHFEKAWHAAKAVKAYYDGTDQYDPTIWRPANNRPGGVLRRIPNREYAGYTVYASGHSDGVYLIDMEGQLVHSWKVPFHDLWDKTAETTDPVAGDKIFARKGVLQPNGDVIILYSALDTPLWGYGLARLDRNSRVLWKYLGRAHHDMDVRPDGRVYALVHRYVTEQQDDAVVPSPVIEDWLVILSPEGEVEIEMSLHRAIEQSDFRSLLWHFRKRTDPPGDYTHANTVKLITPEIASKFRFAKPGQVLVNMRNLGTIMLFDLEQRQAVWQISGAWRHAHDPDFLDDGRMLIFDNKGHYGPEGKSRVLEFDPVSQEITWMYAGTVDDPLASHIRAAVQRLPNGNTLITESHGGRLLEVTRDKQIVWEYVNPIRAGSKQSLVPVIMWGTWFAADDLDPEFRSLFERSSKLSLRPENP